ncbi:MAG: DUF72 domain-containing protein [Candidatus Methanoperedens sp.]|nr:DUF72 domain-containing protein [Candidatus Methanoperedens sp.]
MEKIHIGTMGWSYDFWIGNFYPGGSENLLTEYAKHFNTVEINNTFYGIPSRDTVMKWKEEVPDDFIFSAKFPRKITHIKMLQDCKEELGDKLGPMLMQFPPGFKPDKSEILKDFLAGLPERCRFAVEVRNKKWLDERFYDLLRDNGIALVLIDHPWMPEMNTITADFTYIRWEGDRNKIKGTLGKVEKDRSNDIKDWGMKIKGFFEDSVEVYGYFSKSYSGYPPEDVRMLVDIL